MIQDDPKLPGEIQDDPELPGEIGQALSRLGRVAPPDPAVLDAVLDAAREVLWAAVAAEMLPGEAGRTGSRRASAADLVAEHQTDHREMDHRETDHRETDQHKTDQRETDQPGP
jgi:hypothetical protein